MQKRQHDDTRPIHLSDPEALTKDQVKSTSQVDNQFPIAIYYYFDTQFEPKKRYGERKKAEGTYYGAIKEERTESTRIIGSSHARPLTC